MNLRFIQIFILSILFSFAAYSQAGLNVSGNGTVHLTNNAKIAIDGSVVLNANSQFTVNANDSVVVTEDWTNDGNMSANGGVTLFNSNTDQQIGGSNESKFYGLTVDKAGGNIRLAGDVRVDENLRLLKNTLVDIADDTLTIGVAGNIFTNNANQKAYGLNRSIFSDDGINSGFVRKEIPTTATLPYNYRFPIVTDGPSGNVYNFVDFTFLLGKVTVNADAYVQTKAVATEHPALQIANNALSKYWVLEKENINISSEGANLLFKYHNSEVTTNEGNYEVLEYTPPFPDGSAFWLVNPGAANQVVDINADLIYSEQVDDIEGDWTAGIEDAAISTYYSRADGDYDDPNTWSKLGFGGAPSTTIPTVGSDRVRIRDNAVTIDANGAKVNVISIEENSEIVFTGENYILADTIRVLDEATLRITSADGIDAGNTIGNMRSPEKDFSENVFYIYEGTDALQYTGNGLPATIRTLILDKATTTNILEINEFISIKDSLVIRDGILDIGSYSINGSSPNRLLQMYDGELRIRNSFPANYSAPYFTNGLIHFMGSGSADIPTNVTTPAVLQYHNLEISGNRSGNVTFPSNGQIKIKELFKISDLIFSSTTYQFLTSNSTVIFNKNGGTQTIPIRPQSPTDSSAFLTYHNLIIDSTGNKNLDETGNPFYVVRGDLTLRNQSTFNLNGYDLVVEGDWVNQDAGSIFNSGTNTVIMRSPITASAINITSRDTSENNFYDLVIAGSGIVKPQDELKIANDFQINSTSTFLQQATNVTLVGNWLNLGGTYTTNDAKLYFTGGATQTVTNTVEDEEFDQMIVQNPDGVDVSAVGLAAESGLNVNGDLTLEEGNIITGAKRVTALGSVIRSGATPGHIDGTLWKNIPIAASTTLYEVGTAESYTPVDFEVVGTAGIAGFVSVKADTITAASSPISNGLLPANSLMSDDRNVRRQWSVTVPAISTFDLLTRTYNANLNFIATNDLRNGADPEFFEVRLWDGGQWVFPERLGSPYYGAKTTSSITFFETQTFGTYITGEPSNYSFYSIADGDWSTPASWSIERYGGAATSIEPTLTSNVFIGDDKTITLNADKTNDQFVNIDSSGTIAFNDNHFISGTGEFRLNEYSTIQLAHFQGITTGNSGAVRMGTRNYNYNNHNRGTFEYTGTSNQFIGNGLPDNVFKLFVNKTANSLTFNQPSKTILDSLYIKDGEFEYNSSFTIEGNLRRALGADFSYSSTPIIEFSGDSTQFINDEDTDSLVIYSLRVDKPINNIILEDNSPLNIVDQLRFPGSNEGIIYARKPGNFVLVEGSVNRTGNGHINGPLIKNIPAGDAGNITFEVGDTLYYSPFYLDMRSGTGSTAGYLSLDVKPEDYPYMNGSIITEDYPPIYPGRIVHRYWRLSKPDWSSFVRGTRNFDIRGEYRDSEDWEQLDDYSCADFAFNKHFGDTVLWESIWPDNGGICTDTRDMSRTPSFNNTSGNGTEGYLVYTDVEDVTKPWGTTKTLDNGNLLLGDFVLGNQNGKAQFITFYSRQDGNWTDASTWSTVSHTSNINVSDTVSPTINFRRFPLRQYDNVLIDSGHTVTLDAAIGMGEYTARGNPFRYLAKVGPNTVVKPGGTLDMDIFELRGNSFKVEKGGTVIIGSTDGLNDVSPVAVRGLGNLKSYARAIEDSSNFIFTAKGDNPENSNRNFPYYHNYCTINMGTNSVYIDRVRLRKQGWGGNEVMLDNSTGDSLVNILSFHDFVAEVEPGEQYRLIVRRETATGSPYMKAFIDWNRDGDWTDAGEQVVDRDFNDAIQRGQNFTVPANVTEGYTQMRVIYRSDDNNNPCTNGTGEAEDYSIVVRNPSSVFTQNMGTLIPTTVASIETRGVKHNSVIELNDNVTIIDSLKFTSGILDANGNDIDIAGDIIADTTDGFDPSTGTVTFYEGKDQNLRGAERVDLGTVVINKDSNDINVITNVRVDGPITHTSETIVNIADSDTLTFSNNATLAAGPGGFGIDRNYKVSGTENLAGVLNKEFNNSGGTQSFEYPLAVDTLYNPATLEIDGSYSGVPSLSVQLNAAKHPQRISENILKKYWTVGQENISSLNTMDFTFDYNIPEDTSGNAPRYYPSLYKPSNEWEMDLGTNPTAFPDEINSVNSIYFEGDWTAGESNAFFLGRNYYSRNTGDWDIPSNWSTVGHAGPPSSYFPGEITLEDTVYIDGHRIAFNVDSSQVDTITIGGTFGGVSAAGRGVLDFDIAPLNKKLVINNSVFLDTDGKIEKSVQLGSADTLSIAYDLINNGLAANSAGVDFHNSENDFLLLEFFGSENSSLAGTGNWDAISIVNLEKDGGLLDSLLINSATLGAASPTFDDYGFNLISGVLKHYNNYDFTAANDDGLGIKMNQFAGIAVENGRLISKDEVKTDVNNTIEVSGGEFIVGDEADENFIFQDNTLVNLNGGRMTVAGVFDGDFVGATVRLNVENDSELKVLKVGATDPGKVGLNINAGSELNMNSGRIIVANAIPGSNADYRVNSAVGSGFTGGTVQIGDSTDTNPNAEIKVFGTTPINNLHVVGPTITALQVGSNVSVKNELEIDNDATYNLSTNSLAVGGDITNYGLFDASNGNIADFRLLTLNGAGNQVIFNDDASGLVLHNLTIDKTTGNIELSGAGNSNITVHRNLEFATGNNAYIDGSANGFDPFVELSPSGGSSPTVLRNGKGHMYGRMYRQFPANTANRLFAVGAADIDEYRPANVKTTSNGNTAGLIGVAHYNIDHPNLDNSVMNTAVNILNYWNINSNGFALGVGNKYELKLDYLNPSDLRNGANTTLFEQFLYDPACPPPPAVCPPGTGTWTALATSQRTTTSITSEQNSLYGDVVISEPSGITFYSIADGNWKIASNWSTVGYGGAPAARYPDLNSDIVRIGDGMRITMPSGIVHDRVRAVIVEDVNAPGELYILGSLGSLKASAFTIGDECTLAFSHTGGIADNNTQGALQTNTKSFGVANYIFKAENASMISGKGFPDTTASITVDITDPTESVFTSTYGGAPPIKVRDSISVKEGNYESGNRNFRLYGNFSQYENGLWKPLLGEFLVAGNNEKDFNIGNADGLSFHKLDIIGGDITVNLFPTGGANSHLYVDSELSILDDIQIKVRTDDRKVILEQNAIVSRTGTGFVDGTMQRYFEAGVDSKEFAIGLDDIYTPVTVTTDNGTGGVAGGFDAIALEPVANEPYWGNRLDPAARIERFWKISAGDGTVDLGTRNFDTKFEFPASELASITVADAVIRRETLQAGLNPHWYQRQRTELDWIAANAEVELSATSDLWIDFGNFYIGEKLQRTFYSNNNGDWTDNTSWALDEAGTIFLPPGVYPNNDPTEMEDIVIVDDSDEIALDTIPQVAGLTIQENSTFEIGLGQYVSESPDVPSTFDLTGGTIDNKSEFGIDSDPNQSWVRFPTKNIDTDIDFIFSGTTDQIFGDEFPNDINSLTISNSGPDGDNTVAIGDDDYNIATNLVITDGDLRHSGDGNELSVEGDITTSEPLVLNEDINGNPICSDLTLSGSGAANQNVNGPGAITFCNLNMDRGVGTGIGVLNTTATVTGTVNLLVGANPNSQIFELAAGGDLSVTNTDPNAMTGGTGGANPRMIRTSKAGGSLCRTVTTNGSYTWPIGSLEGGNDLYAPAVLTTDASGADGDICLKTNSGTNTDPLNSHNEVSADADDYISRYWAVNSATTTITGQFDFIYNNADIQGNENNFDRVGNWSNPEEASPGSWTTYNTGIDVANNTFSTPATFDPTDMVGDWTLAELSAFRRIFFSRQTGNWTDANSWTPNSTHIGPIFGAGVTPNMAQDSVVIGGGNAGVNNHIITLDVAGSVTIGGLALGTAAANTGTLMTGPNIINGEYFDMGELSTLGVGSAVGISPLGTATGNIQTTLTRDYTNVPGNTSFIYNGATNQVTGSGLPATVQNFEVDNSGAASDNVVTLQSNIAVQGDLAITQGVADFQTQTANSSNNLGEMSIAANARLRISGTNDLVTSANNYATYNLDILSIVEFYGTAQTVSNLPTNLVSGLGFCVLNNTGVKTVNAPLLIRSDLSVINDATLDNQVGVNSLQVNGSIYNEANIENKGKITIGN